MRFNAEAVLLPSVAARVPQQLRLSSETIAIFRAELEG